MYRILSPAFDNKEIALFFRLTHFAFENIPVVVKSGTSGPNPLFSKETCVKFGKKSASPPPPPPRSILIAKIFSLSFALISSSSISQLPIHPHASNFTRSTLLGNIVSPFLTLFPIFVSLASKYSRFLNSCKSTIAVKCLFPDTFRYRTFDNGELDDVLLRDVDDDEEEEEERAGKNRTAPRNAFWLISTTTRFLPIPTFKDAQKLRGNFRKPSEASCKRATPRGYFVVVVVMMVFFFSSSPVARRDRIGFVALSRSFVFVLRLLRVFTNDDDSSRRASRVSFIIASHVRGIIIRACTFAFDQNARRVL
jgi:hypothetical protein